VCRLCNEKFGVEYTEAMLEETEFYVLRQLDYDFLSPSAIDIALHLLLYISDPR
jgi:hypothetical protein